MKDFTNPALRILAFIEDAVKKQDNTSSAAAWAEVFGLDVKKSTKDPHDVYLRLGTLREELELVESLMQETTFSSELYRPYIEKVKRAISVSNLTAQWLGSKQMLSPETILSMRFCSEIIPSEAPVSIDELQTILDRVRDLRQEIESSQLSKAVCDILLNQLNIIEKAIIDYPFKGGASIRSAFKDGIMDIAVHASELEKENDKGELKKVGGIWADFKAAGKEFVEADKIISACLGLIEKGSKVAAIVLAMSHDS